MMDDMDDLVQFLRARLDEDADLALAASPGPWHPDEEHDEVLAVDDIVVAEGFALSGRQLRATVDHIARHDPARVLAEVESKRLILADYQRYAAERRSMMGGWDSLSPEDSPILTALASVYANHPDYRDTWRP
ncbi:DUF6221 family protein [Streptomyces misionensis]|uniref:DUF6221 family protein n=1 Tax=Streptomyces misionensis TaxID=67331 RepID=UPI0036C47F62